jgi:hypothetical protein
VSRQIPGQKVDPKMLAIAKQILQQPAGPL